MANEISQRLTSLDNQFIVSQLVSAVENIAKQKVILETISLSRVDGRINEVSINGEATSRSSLAEFRDQLEEHSFFDTAELPLSNLAKDKEVPFNIKIVTSEVIYQ